MQIPRDAMLLRIFTGEDERHDHHPLYEAIVLKRARCILPAPPCCAGR